MKILSLNIDERLADLEFSTRDLTILQKCLAVVPITLPNDIYDAAVYGVSRPEALQLAEVVTKILTSITQGNEIILDNALIQLLGMSEDSYQLRISLVTIRGLRSVLVEALCGHSAEKIQEIINESKLSLESLVDFFNKEVLEEFDKDGLSRLTFNHCEQIQYDLGILGKSFRTDDLPPEAASKFCLNFRSHTIVITLHQHDHRRRALGLISYSVSQGDEIIFASSPQWFRYRCLFCVVAYLELVASSPFPAQKLRQYWGSITNALYKERHKTLLIFHVLPQEDESANANTLRIQVMLNTDPTNEQKNIRDNNFTLDEVLDKSNIYEFTTSLKELFARSSGSRSSG
jgi:hypothetical protein